MSLSTLDILVIFVLFCVAWLLTSYIWKIIEGKILIRRQAEMMDQLYSKAIRLVLRAVHDFKDIQEVARRD